MYILYKEKSLIKIKIKNKKVPNSIEMKLIRCEFILNS